jgi:thioredoxin reductase (NADPH)
VTVVHRKAEFRCERILRDRLAGRENVEVIWDNVLDEVLGKGGFPPSVTGARLRNVRTGEFTELAVDGIFVAIGHEPAVALFKDQLRMKPSGYLWTAPDSTATSVPGVHAAGDVADDVFRQAVTAAGLGCMAALEAEKYIFGMEEDMRQAAE